MCGSDTMTQTDIDRGIVNVVIGFAPLKPAALMLRGAEAKTTLSPGAGNRCREPGAWPSAGRFDPDQYATRRADVKRSRFVLSRSIRRRTRIQRGARYQGR